MKRCSVRCSEVLYENQGFPERELSALVASKVMSGDVEVKGHFMLIHVDTGDYNSHM